ncbi:hypothetical protein EV697_10260 [Bisgaardia hudsonensis]|uniref:Uncharacterized protein n=1 Tax=Bisgaardia hudsonensis TaxID=109472 RepID=A0A4R2N0Y3_9PAST|nr:hypothetical protein [Bisgaardia hudsonensis]QLB13232.1 hypothetical protein A6A11_06195 [Bisgaardia hudsonensis]TCP13189.1 hypothetical protein EV697_10260 [Bisgaardia hudsonensis]
MEEFTTFFVLAMIGLKRIFIFVLLGVIGVTYCYFGSHLIDLIPLNDEYYRGLLYALILPGIPLVFCIIWIVAILRNPVLTKKEKWDRLFGKY